MTRRRRAVSVLLLSTVLLGLDALLAVTMTGRASQDFYLDRLGDAVRFASLAEPSLRGGSPVGLSNEVTRYDRTFGIAVAVVARDGHPVLASRAGIEALAGIEGPVGIALAGRSTAPDHVIWPWQDEPVVVAVPVAPDGEVIGAVVTVSPTIALRRRTGWLMAALAGLGLLVVVAVALLER